MEQIAGAAILLVCAVILVALVKQDSQERGAGCVFALLALFVGVVLVTVTGMLAAYGRLP